MKSLFFSLLLAIRVTLCFAQQPGYFSYQAVVRNSSGTVIANQTVSFKISIIENNSINPPSYSESHIITTNDFGLANISIGSGITIFGNFTSIRWSNPPHFIRIEMDIQGGNNYIEMGTSQLSAVPYAMYSPGNYKAGNGISISNDTIYNSKPFQNMNLTGSNGIIISGTFPNFIIDNNLPDQEVTISGDGATTVNGTYPNFIISSTDNNTTYNAGNGIQISGNTVHSTWTKNGEDVSNNNNGNIGIGTSNINPSAILEVTSNNKGFLPPRLTTVERDQISSPATGLVIYNTSSNCLNFWTGSNWFETCGQCTPQPTKANAGNDIFVSDQSTSVTLSGNSPFEGNGNWNIISGDGGVLSDSGNPTSTFSGVNCNIYKLTWTISNTCGNSIDTITINFNYTEASNSFAGIDVIKSFSDSVEINGNIPDIGYGTWHIASGYGGIISNASAPNTYLNGNKGETYQLVWTISTFCSSKSDTIVINFAMINRPCAGIETFTDIRNGKTYNTVQIGNQCWMKENLNIGTLVNLGTNMTNNSIIEKFCYNNLESNCNTYGGLYQWNEMMNYTPEPESSAIKITGICPNGWHLPNWDDWSILTNYLGDSPGIADLLRSNESWAWDNIISATNISGFSAIGSGHCTSFFSGLGSQGNLWIAQTELGNPISISINSASSAIGPETRNALTGIAIRCLKD